jgi:hypothetical protein
MPPRSDETRTSIDTDRSEIMTLKKFSRAGLFALAAALLLAVVVSVPTFHAAYAQTAAAAADAAPPACDA